MKKKCIIISTIVFLIDLISKLIIDNNLLLLEEKKIIPNFFSITKVYNTGASWGILSNGRIVLSILGIVMMIVLIIYQKKFKKNSRNLIAFSLTYGGILGNLLDRIRNGYVIDFFDFNFFGYRYPVFNIADISIVCGIILILIAILKKEDENESNS